MTPSALRLAFRMGELAAPTAALANGYQQANLAIVPQDCANAFEGFLRANPRSCPILARGRVGDPTLPTLCKDIDIRTDLPRYRVLRKGEAAEDLDQIDHLWRDDLVSFAVGCSLSFEADLVAGGVLLRCHGSRVSCSAFDSNIPNAQSGPFGGNMVVSMRAIRTEHVALATALSAKYPNAHGAPVHVGDPAQIGVDLSAPIDGIGLIDIAEGEVPVFWACGVSMERALSSALLPLAITHAPGHMLITDLTTQSAFPE